MTLRNKIIAAMLALTAAFGGGFATARYTAPATINTTIAQTQVNIPAGCENIDPQDFIETVATPAQSGLAAYLKFLDKTQTSVYIAIYGLTENSIGDKLIELHQKGKTVKVLADRSQAKGRAGKALILRLRAAGIEVIIGTSPRSGIMHNKFTIIDGIWVEDGSWNYSASADKQGNLLNFIRSKKRADFLMGVWTYLHAHMSQQNQTLEASK